VYYHLFFLNSSDYLIRFKPSTMLTREVRAKWLISGLATKDEEYKEDKDRENALVPVEEYYNGVLKNRHIPMGP